MSETMYYPIVMMNGELSDLGEVGTETISDGYDDFVAEFVVLKENVKLVKCNGHYYIDQPHQIRRLTNDIILEYGLKDYFYVYRPIEEPKEDAKVIQPKKKGRPKKV